MSRKKLFLVGKSIKRGNHFSGKSWVLRKFELIPVTKSVAMKTSIMNFNAKLLYSSWKPIERFQEQRIKSKSSAFMSISGVLPLAAILKLKLDPLSFQLDVVGSCEKFWFELVTRQPEKLWHERSESFYFFIRRERFFECFTSRAKFTQTITRWTR